MPTSLPARPRLAERVLPRGHWIAGDRRVVLHDARTGTLMQVGLREWTLLAASDGTRDVDGIVLAATREGLYVSRDTAVAFLTQLADVGLLEDGPLDAPAGDFTADPGASSRRIEALAGYSLQCDGRGACCRTYATVLFSQLEAAQARAACPSVLDGGTRADNAFFPQRGAEYRAGLAVALVDGRCAYLEGDGRCGVHRAAGAQAKPMGCRMFPAQLIDDGEVVRVTPAIECACVFASIGATEGAPLLPEHVARRDQLEPAAFVESLGPLVAATADRFEPVAELRVWSRALVAAPAPRDVPAALWALADALDVSGFDAAAALRACAEPPPLTPDKLGPHLAALSRRVSAKAVEDARWRSEADLARAASTLVAAALADIDAGRIPLEPPRDNTREAFAFRALVFGHVFAQRPPVDAALRDHAVRLVAARAVAEKLAQGDHDPALREPIAVVEALVRSHGLANYRDELG